MSEPAGSIRLVHLEPAVVTASRISTAVLGLGLMVHDCWATSPDWGERFVATDTAPSPREPTTGTCAASDNNLRCSSCNVVAVASVVGPGSVVLHRVVRLQLPKADVEFWYASGKLELYGSGKTTSSVMSETNRHF